MVQFKTVVLMACMILIMHGQGHLAHAYTVVDVDGNSYKTVAVNGHVWMTQNLNVSHYRNGDPIRHAATPAEWADAARKRQGAWCYYRNRSGDGVVYGKLYNWYAVNDPRGLAPKGWKIPSDKDWENLEGAFGGKQFAASNLKAASAWQSADRFFTGRKGFRALPGGYRRSDGRFLYGGMNGLFWTSTEFVRGYAWFRNLSGRNAYLFRNDTCMENGLSVRCVRES